MPIQRRCRNYTGYSSESNIKPKLQMPQKPEPLGLYMVMQHHGGER